MVASLQMTLQRINAIERQFASLSQQTTLTVDQPKTDADFQKILDKKVEAAKAGHTKGERVPNSEIDSLIEQYSAKNGVDKDFVKSVVRHESGFNVNATSKCGAMGLLQLMPATAQGLGVTNAYEESPISLVEKGEQLDIKTGDDFYFVFKTEEDVQEPNYTYIPAEEN